jgi:hypothetical protein
VRRAVSTFVNHRHDAEAYDDSEGAVLGRIHIERSFQGDLEGEGTAELLTATAETVRRSISRSTASADASTVERARSYSTTAAYFR